MAIKLQVSSEERKTIQQWLHSHCGSEVRHALILQGLDQGMRVSQVAGMVGLHPERVRQVVRAYRKGGMEALRAQPRPGRPEKLTEEFRHRLVELVQSSPRAHGLAQNVWTLTMLQQVLTEVEWGAAVCLETIRHQLQQAGWSYQRAKAWITSPDPHYAIKKTP